MINEPCLVNQSQSIRDKNILSGEMITNIPKNILISSFSKIGNTLDEAACLHRHTSACTGTGVSGQAQVVSTEARAVPTSNFNRAWAGNKVDIYKNIR